MSAFGRDTGLCPLQKTPRNTKKNTKNTKKHQENP